jgi:hypothetical protein
MFLVEEGENHSKRILIEVHHLDEWTVGGVQPFPGFSGLSCADVFRIQRPRNAIDSGSGFQGWCVTTSSAIRRLDATPLLMLAQTLLEPALAVFLGIGWWPQSSSPVGRRIRI